MLNYTHIFFFFLLTPLHKTLARNHKNPNFSSSSLVLGMTHYSPNLPNPKSSIKKKPLEALDMTEPLREVRDGYLITLNLGTPPQPIQVYMDTGSDLTWVPCGNLTFNCYNCDDFDNDHKNDKLVLSAFSPTHSSSSSRDSCSSEFCIDIHSSDNPFDPCTIAGCSVSMLLRSSACPRPCPSFAYTYGEGGLVTGTLTRDTLNVHGGAKDVQGFCFGCVGSTYREPIGIAGFGRGALSLPSQLGFLQKGFSHCFLPFKFANNPNFSSPLIIGDSAVSNENSVLQFTPMLKSLMYPNYYIIGLEFITIGNISSTQVPLTLREFDSLGNGGMLIDSGTTYTHLPEPVYSQLLTVLQASVTYPRAKDMEERTGFDLCYRVPCPNNDLDCSKDDFDGFPTIVFRFLNNVSVELPRENVFYAMSKPSNSTVVKCLLFRSMDDGDYGPAGVFGSFQQQNVRVVYDLEEEKIGFQPTDCAAVASAHGLNKSS